LGYHDLSWGNLIIEAMDETESSSKIDTSRISLPEILLTTVLVSTR